MRKLPAQEEKIRRSIRDIVAIDPLISNMRLQDALFERGFKTANNNPLDRVYVTRLRDKIHKKAIHEADNQLLAPRIVEFKEKNRLVFDRLVRIAFYTDDLKKEGTMAPTFMEQIAALNSIVKLDLAVFNAELGAKVFEKHIEIIENEKRFMPLPEELKTQMMQAFMNWGLIPPEEKHDENTNITTTAIVVAQK
jgi:hypothetical protein